MSLDNLSVIAFLSGFNLKQLMNIFMSHIMGLDKMLWTIILQSYSEKRCQVFYLTFLIVLIKV